MNYSLYHKTNSNYELVTTLNASSLENAFKLAQNFNREYAKLNIRSTSVGDILQSEEDSIYGICYLVCEIGFLCVEDTTLDKIKAIKAKIRLFYQIYDILVKEWNSELVNGCNATYPETVVCSNLLQNMGFDSSNSQFYDKKSDEKDLQSKFEALKTLNIYNNKCFMTDFAFNEVESIMNNL